MEFASDRTRESITDFFNSNTNANSLQSFRALCNGIKASLIEMSVKALRKHCQISRLAILDVGSGKAGDIFKWSRHRPQRIIGLDISPDSVDVAKARFHAMLQQGRLSSPIEFHCTDCANTAFPVEDQSISIISSQFSLQFFLDSEESLHHVIKEATRVLKPGGIFVGCFPDGDKISSVMLNAAPDKVSHVIGHFLFRQFGETMAALSADPPVGIPYTFALGESESCLEYVAYSAYVEFAFSQQGFEGAFENNVFSMDAQRFYVDNVSVQNTVRTLLGSRWCSSTDWETLTTFRVFLARKKKEQPPATEAKSQKRGKNSRSSKPSA